MRLFDPGVARSERGTYGDYDKILCKFQYRDHHVVCTLLGISTVFGLVDILIISRIVVDHLMTPVRELP